MPDDTAEIQDRGRQGQVFVRRDRHAEIHGCAATRRKREQVIGLDIHQVDFLIRKRFNLVEAAGQVQFGRGKDRVTARGILFHFETREAVGGAPHRSQHLDAAADGNDVAEPAAVTVRQLDISLSPDAEAAQVILVQHSSALQQVEDALGYRIGRRDVRTDFESMVGVPALDTVGEQIDADHDVLADHIRELA